MKKSLQSLKRAFVWFKYHLYFDDFCVFLFFCLILFLLMLAGCKSPKHLTDETIVRIKDSLVINYIDSLVTIEVPKERIVDVVPVYDTLKLNTSLAHSEAYVDTATHTIKGSLENNADAVLEKVVYLPSETHIVYKDSIKKEPYPVEIVKIKTKTPKWAYWILVGFASAVAFIFRKQVFRLVKLIIGLF